MRITFWLLIIKGRKKFERKELELLQSKYDKWLKIKAQSEDSTLTKKVKKNKK